MKVGIGLRSGVPGITGDGMMSWAARADASPFSTLAVTDRVVFDNFEPLIVLAGAAALTKRVRLMTTVLVSPVRDPVILAKQATSLDAISNGRLTLGLAVGARRDDFEATKTRFSRRGRLFDEQLAVMKRVWNGEPLSDSVGPIGPLPAQPGGPEILIGGSTEPALRRVGRWADGFIAGGGGADRISTVRPIVEASWNDAGREGSPRLVGTAYVAVGEDAGARGADRLRNWYRSMGPRAELVVQALLTTPEDVKESIRKFADAGADELILWPCVTDDDQFDRIAEVVL